MVGIAFPATHSMTATRLPDCSLSQFRYRVSPLLGALREPCEIAAPRGDLDELAKSQPTVIQSAEQNLLHWLNDHKETSHAYGTSTPHTRGPCPPGF